MPARKSSARALVSARAARRLLLHGADLLADPRAKRSLGRIVRRLGFVQLDSINVVARAHHLTLGSRWDAYRPTHLDAMARRRSVFEHWTHDAAAIDTSWFVPWRHRARRMAENPRTLAWLAHRMGRRWKQTLEHVLARVRDEGPLMSKDFAHEESHGRRAWWGWKPAKAALEYLWWRGDLTIARREHFHKVYDLTERCFPDLHDAEPPDEATYTRWACAEAFDRLTVATPAEVRGFHGAVSLAEARAVCEEGVRAGDLEPVAVEAVDGAPSRPAYARRDWQRRLARAEAALSALPDRMRLLSPFDPVVRDRARASRLFDFDYRFEAFTPEPKRVHGYYVLPVLRGEDLMARADAKLHRKEGVLALGPVVWEPKRGKTKKERRLLEAAADRLAAQIGAKDTELRYGTSPGPTPKGAPR